MNQEVVLEAALNRWIRSDSCIRGPRVEVSGSVQEELKLRTTVTLKSLSRAALNTMSCTRDAATAGQAAAITLASLVLFVSLDMVRGHGEGDGASAASGTSPWARQPGADSLSGSLATKGIAGAVTAFDGATVQAEDGPPGHSHSLANTNSSLKGGNIPHVLVIYYSESGHTKYLADIILNGALDLIPSCHIKVLPVEKANYTVLQDWADVLAIGSPVHHGLPAKPLLAYLDGAKKAVNARELSRLRGASFVTGAGIGGGQELVIDQLNSALAAISITPLMFPDCRYQLGLAAITAFPPFCRQGNSEGLDGCHVPADAAPGQIHPKFETYGYEYGRQLVRLLADPNAAAGPY